MLPPTRRILIGAFLLTGRSVGFHVPITPSLSRHLGQLKFSTIATGSDHVLSPRRRCRAAESVRMMSSMQEAIERKLNEALSPVYLEVINESHMHSGPATESHFKVVIVSGQFEGKALLARHRMVNSLFLEEMKGDLHALSIQGKTPSQWEDEGHKVIPSPRCLGGSKGDTAMSLPPLVPEAQRRGPRQAWGRGRDSRRKSKGWGGRVGRLVVTAGLVALLAWRSCLGTANAAGVAASGGPAGPMSDPTKRATLSGSVDTAFYMFVESLGRVLDKESALPWDQAAVMFSAAWVTTSVAPIAAAGLLGQPLGRAMAATATCHASYAVYKFFLAVVAVLGFQIPESQKMPQYERARSEAPSAATSASGIEKSSKSDQAPARFFEPVRLRTRGRGGRARRSPVRRAERGTTTDGKRSQVVYTRRVSPIMIPRVWLMLVTAMGGPAIGAVSAVAAYSKGHTVLTAAFSSLIRGSLLGTLAAGTLCFGAAGTELVVKWAVFQGIVGALFAAILSPSMLAFLAIYTYYKGLRTNGPTPRGGDRAGGDGDGGGGGGGDMEHEARGENPNSKS